MNTGQKTCATLLGFDLPTFDLRPYREGGEVAVGEVDGVVGGGGVAPAVGAVDGFAVEGKGAVEGDDDGADSHGFLTTKGTKGNTKDTKRKN